jgi:hypothetical protein
MASRCCVGCSGLLSLAGVPFTLVTGLPPPPPTKIQSDFDKTVGKAITVLGLAVIKLLSSMYAYFHGADSTLGQTPTNIDHTKRAWVRRSNIAELNARLGLPEVGIADGVL